MRLYNSSGGPWYVWIFDDYSNEVVQDPDYFVGNVRLKLFYKIKIRSDLTTPQKIKAFSLADAIEHSIIVKV